MPVQPIYNPSEHLDIDLRVRDDKSPLRNLSSSRTGLKPRLEVWRSTNWATSPSVATVGMACLVFSIHTKMDQQRWPAWTLIGWYIFSFSSATPALISTKLYSMKFKSSNNQISAISIPSLEFTIFYYHYTISVNDHSSYFAASTLQFHLPVPLHVLTSRLIASLSWGELHDAPRSDLHNGTCSLHHRCPLSLCYIFLQRFCFLLLYMQRKKESTKLYMSFILPNCLSVGLRSKLICKVL